MANQHDVNIKEQYILSDAKGEIGIYIPGCYGSNGVIDEVWFEQDKADYLGHGDLFVKLVSDICSG